MAVLSLCRLGAGLGLGAEIVNGFAMVNEFAPMNRRGHWCAIVSLVANCGVPIAMLLCAWIIPRWSWRPLFVAIGWWPPSSGGCAATSPIPALARRARPLR